MGKMDIKMYLPCKKPRRSNRLEVKEKEEVKEKLVKEAALGYFSILPIEVKFILLKYLSDEELSLLTIVSKAMRNLVEVFYVSQPPLKKELMHKLHVQNYYLPMPVEKQTACFKAFSKLGLLTKRSTCLYSTKERLKFINEFLTRMMCVNYSESCDDMSKCIAMTCFGKFFHTVIAGWDDCECIRAFDAICAHTVIMKNVKLVISSKQGGHQKLEFEIRCFFRRVFLDQCSSLHDRAFWLTRILKPWPLVHQARLLFLLYGPVLSDEILWNELCENTPSSQEQSAQHFGELANAIQILHHYKEEWTEDDIVSIIDELSSSPEEWLAENVAHLLILCGDYITSRMLISKAINGRMLELSSITTSFCVVCVKNNFSMNYVISMIQHILTVVVNVKDREQFFSSVANLFKELILDVHEYDEDQGNDMYFLVTSLVEFTKKVMLCFQRQFD